jgi:hypothetical protein
MKVTIFWYVAEQNVQKQNDVPEVRTAFVIRAMTLKMEAVSTA